MLATCHSNSGSAIPLVQRYGEETDETDYSFLKVGSSYEIYALLFMLNRVEFLIRAPGVHPFWVPSCLFDLVYSQVPKNWELCFPNANADYKALFESFKINCILGYPLLVRDYKHYIGLLERDSRELVRFYELYPN